ncbi:hypothetical protein D3C80_1519080 [compost metagenome]
MTGLLNLGFFTPPLALNLFLFVVAGFLHRLGIEIPAFSGHIQRPFSRQFSGLEQDTAVGNNGHQTARAEFTALLSQAFRILVATVPIGVILHRVKTHVAACAQCHIRTRQQCGSTGRQLPIRRQRQVFPCTHKSG